MNLAGDRRNMNRTRWSLDISDNKNGMRTRQQKRCLVLSMSRTVDSLETVFSASQIRTLKRNQTNSISGAYAPLSPNSEDFLD
jgi:hypothetical protein